MSSSFAKTSVFFGAPLACHARMIAEVILYFAVGISGFVLPALGSFRTRGAGIGSEFSGFPSKMQSRSMN